MTLAIGDYSFFLVGLIMFVGFAFPKMVMNKLSREFGRGNQNCKNVQHITHDEL